MTPITRTGDHVKFDFNNHVIIALPISDVILREDTDAEKVFLDYNGHMRQLFGYTTIDEVLAILYP